MVVTSIDWSDALSALNSLLPNSRDSIRDKRGFLPDRIADAASAAGLSFTFLPMKDYESLDDLDILARILPESRVCGADVIVITDESFVRGGPFRTAADSLNEFASWHRLTFGRFVFDGDVILLFPARSQIVLFHHEGYYASIDCLSH
ncbi:hypothetical protein [Planctellipticum variicoloris]|uniref:hypothetical protein n=1 Tax=Planctellipticum variicoloris TaxID=3064265 RepID=UPI0030137B13|nr:hypothetical protein SH412_005192 [Planctomycetaceae bacterium SH412]